MDGIHNSVTAALGNLIEGARPEIRQFVTYVRDGAGLDNVKTFITELASQLSEGADGELESVLSHIADSLNGAVFAGAGVTRDVLIEAAVAGGFWCHVDTAMREASNRKYSVELSNRNETVIRLNSVSGEVVGRFHRQSRDSYDAEIRTPGLQYVWTDTSLASILNDVRDHSNLHIRRIAKHLYRAPC